MARKILRILLIGFLFLRFSEPNTFAFSRKKPPVLQPGTSSSSPLKQQGVFKFRRLPDGKVVEEFFWQGKLMGEVIVLEPKTRLFHWGKNDVIQDWNRRQHVDSKLFDRMIAPGLDNRVGPGFYVSRNPFDSVLYGDAVSVVILQQPTRLLRSWFGNVPLDSLEVFNGFKNQLEREHVYGIELSGSWISIFSSLALDRIGEPTSEDAELLAEREYLTPLVLSKLDRQIKGGLPADVIIRKSWPLVKLLQAGVFTQPIIEELLTPNSIYHYDWLVILSELKDPKVADFIREKWQETLARTPPETLSNDVRAIYLKFDAKVAELFSKPSL